MRFTGFVFLVSVGLAVQSNARTFYLDSEKGCDSNTGVDVSNAWKSLGNVNGVEFKAGDCLQLKRGSRFKGGVKLKLDGTAEQPIVIEAYGEGRAPLIDAKGYLAGVYLRSSHYVTVRDLEITADGGKTLDRSKPGLRYGVLVQGKYGSTSHITLENLTINRIYPEVGTPNGGRNPTSYLGTAISIEGNPDKPCTDFLVQDCQIEQTGFKAVNLKNIRQAQVLNNHMKDIGGPAIQPGNVDDLVVRGNIVDGSGSSLDPRMHGRGSGIWPWTSNRVLIEKNRFMHARGKGDSCGIHIDFNCRDVVVQYNMSIDNEGGFVEILGNNHNCTYRYNISVNDGSRIKGKNRAHQEGKVLWTSGFVGREKKKNGPYNSYIYNNTIYVEPNSRSCFSISPTTDGILVANNIFYILGDTENVSGDQDKRKIGKMAQVKRAVIENNLYVHRETWPRDLPFREKKMRIGDPEFKNPGGAHAEDYIPQNASLIRDKGIVIPRIGGDSIGVSIGLNVTRDFLGNPILKKPDIGAVEISR